MKNKFLVSDGKVVKDRLLCEALRIVVLGLCRAVVPLVEEQVQCGHLLLCLRVLVSMVLGHYWLEVVEEAIWKEIVKEVLEDLYLQFL